MQYSSPENPLQLWIQFRKLTHFSRKLRNIASGEKIRIVQIFRELEELFRSSSSSSSTKTECQKKLQTLHHNTMIESVPVSQRPNSLASDSFDSALLDSYSQKETSAFKADGRNSVRRVRFYPRVLMQETLHIKNYTPAEIAMSRYSQSELEKIKDDLKKILSEYPFFVSEDMEYNCAMYRGLEGFTRHGAKKRREHRRAGWSAVLRKSSLGSAKDINNSRVVQSYRQVAELSMMEAIKRATNEGGCTNQQTQSQNVHELQQDVAMNMHAWIRNPKQPLHPIHWIFRRISCH